MTAPSMAGTSAAAAVNGAGPGAAADAVNGAGPGAAMRSVFSVGQVERSRAIIAHYDQAVVEFVQAGTEDVVQAARALVGSAKAATDLLRELDRVPQPSTAALAWLHPREVQVLVCMARGLENRAIGEELGLTEETVKTYNQRLFRKLGAHGRAHVVAIGYELGLLGGTTATTEHLRQTMVERRAEIDRLTANVHELRAQRDELAAANVTLAARHRAEIDRLTAEHDGGGPR